MGLLLYSNPLPLTTASSRSSSSSSSSSSPSPTSSPSPFSATISWMHMKPDGLRPKFFSGVRLRMPVVKRSGSVVVKASSDIDGTAAAAAANEGSEPLPDSKEEVAVPVDKLPLESKLKERLEQKAKMQLAKKIRLRRNRLVRKRKLRKKGRWPPSKMKKLKNV